MRQYVGWFVALGAVFLLGAKGGPLLVQAQSFELVDDEGNVRATLTLHDGEPALTFLDEDGNATEVVGMQPRVDAPKKLGRDKKVSDRKNRGAADVSIERAATRVVKFRLYDLDHTDAPVRQARIQCSDGFEQAKVLDPQGRAAFTGMLDSAACNVVTSGPNGLMTARVGSDELACIHGKNLVNCYSELEYVAPEVPDEPTGPKVFRDIEFVVPQNPPMPIHAVDLSCELEGRQVVRIEDQERIVFEDVLVGDDCDLHVKGATLIFPARRVTGGDVVRCKADGQRMACHQSVDE